MDEKELARLTDATLNASRTLGRARERKAKVDQMKGDLEKRELEKPISVQHLIETLDGISQGRVRGIAASDEIRRCAEGTAKTMLAEEEAKKAAEAISRAEAEVTTAFNALVDFLVDFHKKDLRLPLGTE